MAFELYRRALRLQVGGLEIDQSDGSDRGLRVKFAVERDKTIFPNNCTIQVWNLNPENRAKLEEEKYLTCQLEAGYTDLIDQIFFGVVRQAESVHEGHIDWVTTISAGDGEDR